jgi:acyl carrier protein
MTPDEIRRIYLDELTKVAPDIEADAVGEEDHLQDDLDLDSMDVLNFVAALHERTGVNIPEPDYPEIATLARAVPYLTARA